MAEEFDPYHQWLGIPPKFQPPNHYRLLAIEEFEDNPDVIENAADRQMAHVRLFQSGPNGEVSQRVLNEISAAKVCLLNKQRKAEYDAKLRAEKKAAEPARPQPQPREVRGERAVRKAQALDPPAAPPPAYSPHGAPADPLDPPFVAPSVRTRRTIRRGRRVWNQAIIAGTLVGVMIVAVIFYFVWRSGKDATSSVNPSPTPDSITPTPNPGTKPKTNGKDKPKAGGQKGQHVLRLYGRDYVELADTAERVEAPLTAEMWVRFDPTKPRTYLMGNVAAPGWHPSVTSGPALGWALSYTARMRTSDGAERAGLLLQVPGRVHLGQVSNLDGEWHHVALCIEPVDAGVAFRVFLDGRRVLSTKPAAAPAKSPANFCLGCPPHLPASAVAQADMAVRGFRLSSAVRYLDQFPPPDKLATDPLTLALLDLTQGKGVTVSDSSGKGHAGRIVGGQWIGVDESAAPPEETIDLMQGIEWRRDTEGGNWSLTGGNVVKGEAAAPQAILRFPHHCPREYDFELIARRQGGDGVLAIGLAYGSRRVALLCDNEKGTNTLLQAVTGPSTAKSVYNGVLLPTDQSRTLLIQVRLTGITILADGKPIITWRGDPASLSLPPQWAKQTVGEGLFLGLQNSGFQFDKLELRRTSTTSAKPSKTGVVSKPDTPKQETPAPRTRSPVPAAAELEKARQQVQESIKKELAEASTPPLKVALAQKLVERAESNEASAAVRYALIQEARELAVQAADVELTLLIQERLVASFELDAGAQALETLSRLAAAVLTAPKRKALVEAMLSASEDAVSEENFKVAPDLAALTYKTAAKVGDAELSRKANALRQRVEHFRAWWDDAEKARKTLAEKPDDPQANTALGKYLCFVPGDWEKGLAHLAKSDDVKLKTAAVLEQAPPNSPDKQVATGDAWWDLASSAKDQTKLAFQKRAQHWYQQALEGLKGPAKSTVEKRLAILEKATGDASGGNPALAKQLTGDFYLTATAKRDGSVTNSTLNFANDGSFSDNQLPCGRWSREGGRVRVTFEDQSRGTVSLRGKDKDAFVGQQTLGNGDIVTWELKRVVVVSVWDVHNESVNNSKTNRLVLYSNGKGNDIYGNTTWSVSGNSLKLDWRDYRLRETSQAITVRGTFTIEGGGKLFRGRTDIRTWVLRGERIASGK